MTRSTKRQTSFAKDGVAINVSSRIPANRDPSFLMRELARLDTPLDLTLTNPTRVGLVYPDISAALAEGAQEPYEPDARGLLSARAFLAKHLRAREDEIIITASTSEAYAIAFKTLLDPGGLIAAPRPSYPLVPHLAELEGLETVYYDLDRDDLFRIELGSLENALQRGARVVVVVSPNNPTGTVVGDDELHAVARLCVRYNASMVIDRVFAAYALEGIDVRAPNDLPGLVIELDGLSKRAGMPHIKLAWMLVRGAPQIVDALAWTNDAYLSASGPAQAALPALWRHGEMIAKAIHEQASTNLVTLSKIVASVPAITRLPVAAGWSAVLRLPRVVDDDGWVLALARAGVRVHPGYFYDFPHEGYVVVSLLPDPSTFRRAVSVLTRLCGEMV